MPPDSVLERFDALPAFRSLEIADRLAYSDWLAGHPLEVSELTFTNLFAWRRSHSVTASRHGGFLIPLLGSETPFPHLYPPIGEGDLPAATRAAFDAFEKLFPGVSPRMDRVPEPVARTLESAGFRIEEDRANFDYVYWVSKMVRLEGRNLSNKRNRIRRCLDANACAYEAMTPDNIPECLGFQEEWRRARNAADDPGVNEESDAVRDSLERFVEFGLFGGLVRIDGRVQAFAVGEMMDSETAVEHFEKANPAVDGLYQVMLRWFCENALQGVTWLNREQDLGIPGLRQAKMSYLPDKFISKYSISRG
ncbi:MAG TPA: phosphatidylglycerol lysyltransferase domain-containing protein [Candidatus Brocadiia bacterium]|nr:phosphatidylglycerol lysyltransferase domain-containing protein [Candidatus Brocadiia bacterium]